MKSVNLARLCIATGGFCFGVFLQILYIIRSINRCKQEEGDTKCCNDTVHPTENLNDLTVANDDSSGSPLLTYIRCWSRLCVNDDTHSRELHEQDYLLDIQSCAGTNIREVIQNESRQPMSFESLGALKRLFVIHPEDGDAGDNFAKFDFMSDILIKDKTQSEPCFSLSSPKIKTPPKRVYKSGTTVTKTNGPEFQKFADQHLKMPSIMFITPYPTHTIYRRLRAEKRADFGCCHSIIVPNIISLNKTLTRYLDQQPTFMDWSTINNSDYNQNPLLAKKFQNLFLHLRETLISDECWRHNYYTPVGLLVKELKYIQDLTEYQIFIQPLYLGLNSRICYVFDEYYKIVSK